MIQNCDCATGACKISAEHLTYLTLGLRLRQAALTLHLIFGATSANSLEALIRSENIGVNTLPPPRSFPMESSATPGTPSTDLPQQSTPTSQLDAGESTFSTQAAADAPPSSPLEYHIGWLASSNLYPNLGERQHLQASIAPTNALPLPSQGFGVLSSLKPNPRLAITAGVHEDILHRMNSGDADRNAYFYALGVGYRPSSPGPSTQQFQLTAWRRQLLDDSAQSSGVTFGLAQHFNRQIVWSPFLNLRYQQDEATGDSETSASTGIDLSGLPWNRRAVTGIAYAHEQSSKSGRGSHALEIYYRLPLTPYLEVTPDMQLTYHRIRSAQMQSSLASRIHFKLLF